MVHKINMAVEFDKDDLDYYCSSTRFYENAVDDFGFLSNLYTVFDEE